MAKPAILRSMLYIPANSWRMVVNGLSGMEDAVILDLEDAVPVGEKETGRIFARDSISMFRDAGINVFVRVNSFGSGLTEEDISKVVARGLDGIMLPKTETENDIVRLDKLLAEEERKKDLQSDSIDILALVESPRGVQNAFGIAAASPRLIGIGFGAGDFLREMGAGFAVTRLSPEAYYPLILYARSRIALAARISKVEATDTPFFGLLIDTEGLHQESEQVKLLGFTGKQLIHPRHVDTINEVFTPSEEDIEYAKSVVAAYEEAEARGAGAATFKGRMIDYAMYRMGKDVLAKADAIRDKADARHEKVF